MFAESVYSSGSMPSARCVSGTLVNGTRRRPVSDSHSRVASDSRSDRAWGLYPLTRSPYGPAWKVAAETMGTGLSAMTGHPRHIAVTGDNDPYGDSLRHHGRPAGLHQPRDRAAAENLLS